ncbi:hypothetical protein EOM09_03095 [bacterium]|nr:hypothetical protein [bacterium]
MNFFTLSTDNIEKCIKKNNYIYMDSKDLFLKFNRFYSQLSVDVINSNLPRGILSSDFCKENNITPVLIYNLNHNSRVSFNSKKINDFLIKNKIYPYISHLCKNKEFINFDEALLELVKETEYIINNIYGKFDNIFIYLIGRNYGENIDFKNMINILTDYKATTMFFDNIDEFFGYIINKDTVSYSEMVKKKRV